MECALTPDLLMAAHVQLVLGSVAQTWSRLRYVGVCLIQRQHECGTAYKVDMHAGPLNYNPVEEWFFHRIKAGRPIPVPNSGLQVGSCQ